MLNVTVNLDISTDVNIEGIFTGHSFEIRFTKYEDKLKTTPENFEGEYVMLIWRDEAKRNLYKTYTEGQELTKSANVLTIKMSKEENDLEQSEYFYQIICDFDTAASYVEYKGKIKVNTSR